MNTFRILLIISIVALSAAIQAQPKKITIDDLTVNYTFYPEQFDGFKTLSDNESYTWLDDLQNIVKTDFATGNNEVLYRFDSQRLGDMYDYAFNADGDNILLITDYQPIYRRSFTARCFIHSRSKKTTTPAADGHPVQVPVFAPQGQRLAYVKQNNLYVQDLESGNITAVTADGKMNEIINGIPDWVYEEEFEFNQAYAWSPDGTRLAYLKFDERKVPEYGMLIFNSLYPEYRVWKYPKAGEANSIVTAHVFDIQTGKTTDIDLGTETDQYIPRIFYTNDPSRVCLLRLNRLQNVLEILLADAQTGKTTVVYREENKYYIDETLFESFRFLPQSNRLIFMSEKDGYAHICIMDINGENLRQLTSGAFDVLSIQATDEKKQLVYYLAVEGSPLHNALYQVSLKTGKTTRLTSGQGISEVDFGGGNRYFVHSFSNAATPPHVSLCKSNGDQIRTLVSNRHLAERAKEYDLPKTRFFSFTTSEGVQLNGYMVLPSDFDSTRTWPVMMYQYSGPNSQEVRDEWNVGFSHFLAQQGYIYVCVDGRGTGARGEEFRKMTYLKLGRYESIDQIEAARYLGSLPYVDASRIGIWGWSFGGYVSALCMTKGNGIFRAGISVAPVTNWRYYDNIYTERFMRTPAENADGYDSNSPTTHAEMLKGSYLIIHGTADDNVHLQNTYEFAEALVQARKEFEMQIYTDRNHAIYGGNTRWHLYNRMWTFISKNL